VTQQIPSSYLQKGKVKVCVLCVVCGTQMWLATNSFGLVMTNRLYFDGTKFESGTLFPLMS
jgi:hypothetical protein